MNHFVGLITVVLGIVIAFNLDRYAERQRNLQAELRHLIAIQKELPDAIESAEERIKINDSRLKEIGAPRRITRQTTTLAHLIWLC